MAKFKTMLLMLGLVLLFMYTGNLVAGEQGMAVAFLMACGRALNSLFATHPSTADRIARLKEIQKKL